jgi:hypothetical protein
MVMAPKDAKWADRWMIWIFIGLLLAVLVVGIIYFVE